MNELIRSFGSALDHGVWRRGRAYQRFGVPDFDSHPYSADSGSKYNDMAEEFWLHFYKVEEHGATPSMFSTVIGRNLATVIWKRKKKTKKSYKMILQ